MYSATSYKELDQRQSIYTRYNLPHSLLPNTTAANLPLTTGNIHSADISQTRPRTKMPLGQPDSVYKLAHRKVAACCVEHSTKDTGINAL